MIEFANINFIFVSSYLHINKIEIEPNKLLLKQKL